MLFCQRRIVTILVPVCGVLLFFGLGDVFAQGTGPTFIPNRAGYEQNAGTFPGPMSSQPNWPDAQDAVSTLLTSGDPVTLIPHALQLANKYGILQCVFVLTVVFVFHYVRNAQKSALQREEFFRQQLEHSDRRTTEDLSRLSTKLAELDQDFRSLQEKFDRHSELIRANGELSREIVKTMAAHNQAVEKGIGELSFKLDHLAFQRNVSRMKPS